MTRMNTDDGQEVERADARGPASPKTGRFSASSGDGLVSPKLLSVGGFTLIEVLVALVIFAFSGVILASSYVNVLSAHQAALHRDDFAADRQMVRDALWAQPVLEKVTAWNDLTLPDERAARWRATVTATPIADLFDVTLEVELTGADGKRLPAITETCRLLRPTWSQPADRETLRAAARSKLALRTFQ